MRPFRDCAEFDAIAMVFTTNPMHDAQFVHVLDPLQQHAGIRAYRRSFERLRVRLQLRVQRMRHEFKYQ